MMTRWQEEDLIHRIREVKADVAFREAEQFLKNHYQTDDLDADTIRRDDERWERVMGDPEKFPDADLDFITRFGDHAATYLGGLSHDLPVEA